MRWLPLTEETKATRAPAPMNPGGDGLGCGVYPPEGEHGGTRMVYQDHTGTNGSAAGCGGPWNIMGGRPGDGFGCGFPHRRDRWIWDADHNTSE